jgi:hypothetical protein
VQAVLVDRHANTGTASLVWAVLSGSDDLVVIVNLVELQHRKLGWLSLVLSLLGTTAQAKHQVQSRLLLDVVVGKGAAVLELFASEDQALLVGRDP